MRSIRLMILCKHVYNLLFIIIILVLDISLPIIVINIVLDMHDSYTTSMKIINGQNLSDYQSSIVNNLSTLIEMSSGNNFFNGFTMNELKHI